MRAFNLHIPGWVYSMTCYGETQKDALLRFKSQHKLSRMPRGYAIWSAE